MNGKYCTKGHEIPLSHNSRDLREQVHVKNLRMSSKEQVTAKGKPLLRLPWNKLAK